VRRTPFIAGFNQFVFVSIRAKLRNGDPGYDITSNFFLRCLYDGESGDPESPEKGFLKGPLLVRVSPLRPNPSYRFDSEIWTRLSVIFSHRHHLPTSNLLPSVLLGDVMSHLCFV
jgi:hypothetical protein